MFLQMIWYLRCFQLTMTAVLILVHLEHSLCESEDVFNWLASEHDRVCYTHATCLKRSTESVESPCCGSCTCEPDCKKLGICCLNQYSNLSDARESTESNIYRCVPVQYFSDKETNVSSNLAYWMVSKCKLAYPYNENKTRCENPGHDVAVDSIIPVSDVIGKEVYRNRYCFYCNNIGKDNHLVPWKATVGNENPIDPKDEMFWKRLKAQRGNVLFEAPNFIPINTCYKYQPAFHISLCNVTGLWPVYNRSIEAACESFIDPFNHTYRNYFCYLCNVAENPSPGDWICTKGNTTSGNTVYTPPFAAILDITVLDTDYDESKDLISCGRDQFPDYKKMVCRDIHCNNLRYLRYGLCSRYTLQSHFLGQITGSPCFLALFKLTPHVNSTPTMIIDTKQLNDNIWYAISDLLDLTIWKTFKLIPMYARDFNAYVEYAIVILIIPFDIDMHYDVYYDLFDRLINFGKDHVSLKFPTFSKHWFLTVAQYNYSVNNTMASVFVPDKTDGHVKELHTSYSYETDYCSEKTITINKLNACPFLHISVDEFIMEIEDDLLIVDVNGTTNHTRVFSKWEYELHGEIIYMCLEDFEKIYHKMPDPVPEPHGVTSKVLHPKNILSLVCVCVSTVCLLVTIVTYGKFSVLQSQPGVNNLILCVFLLLAQGFYQFGAGQTMISTWACALIGGICHFLWLSVMLSMNVCCIQMIVSFRKHILITDSYIMKQTVKNILHIIGFSVLFVCVNLVVSLVQSRGQSSGYGGELCYISSFTMQLITFVLPSLIALLSNFVMFVYAVYNITQVVHSTHMLNREKSYLRVYVRLSALTGMTWIVGFLQLVLKQGWLEYIFIIFNASQGVFIMLAFVLNKRVMSLFCKRVQVSSTLQQTSLKRTFSEPVG